jgi:putative peptidoglycan lipid II flippase
MLKSSGAMALATLTSRVLGMVRVMVYAPFMGNTPVASAFILAFTIPNLFRRLLGEGALTAAFIPIFKKKEIHEGEQEMWRSANAVISGLLVATSLTCLIVMAGISVVLVRGTFKPETMLMLRLLRVMFPYMILVCLAAALIGMANARGHFFVPALGAAALNVVMIASVVFLAPRMGLGFPKEERSSHQIFALAIGVLAAGVAQIFFQVPSLYRDGFRFRWTSPWHDPTVREVIKKMLPASIGVAAFQLNIVITQSCSFWFDSTIVSTFDYSVRLMELPQGMFGISLATFLLPTLSGLAAEKKYTEFRQTLKQGLGYLAFVNLIAASVSLVLAEPIVRLLFERGKFDATTTQRVSLALMCLAPGLLMFSMTNILARAFFALNDIKTPMKISIACLALNLVFALWLVRGYREAGLAVANSLSAVFNVWLLLHALRKKLSTLEFSDLGQVLAASLAAAVLAGEAAYLLRLLWETNIGHLTFTQKLGEVFVPMVCAGLIYWGVTLWLKVPGAQDILGLLRRRIAPTE